MADNADFLRQRFASVSSESTPKRRLARQTIDDDAIERLRLDPRKQAWLADDDPTALGFKVRKQRDHITFNFIARNPDGKVVNVLIGSVGVVKLTEAREKARAMRREIADGLCPALEQDAAKTQQKAQRVGLQEARAMTVRAAVDLKLRDKKLSAGSKKNYRALLNVSLKPVASKRLDRISKAEWRKLLEQIEEDVSPVQASKVKRMVSALYRIAVAKSESLTLDNPLAKLAGEFTDSGKRRQGHLKPEAMRGWLQGLEHYGNTTRGLALFMLMTGMREAEARLLRWDEVRTGMVVLPPTRTKVKKELRLPITPAMSAILEVQGWTENKNTKGFVFPSTRRSKSGARGSILPLLKTLGTTCHDLRRTALTQIDALGFPSNVRLRIGNHAARDEADGYLVADDDAVLAALVRYHDWLAEHLDPIDEAERRRRQFHYGRLGKTASLWQRIAATSKGKR